LEISFSGASQAVLQAAVSEADQMDCAELTTGHLLLGLLRNDGTPAFRLLHDSGVRINEVRPRVEEAVALGPERGSSLDDVDVSAL
jgi:ATP-dependent Clp protease ATP-binding subunit ClpA